MPNGIDPAPDIMPPPALPMLEAAGSQDFFLSPRWFAVLAETTLAPGERAHTILAADVAGRPVAALPAVVRGRRLRALTSCYTCSFTPILGDPAEQAARALAQAVAAHRPRWDGLAIDALPAESPAGALLADGLEQAGFRVQRYRHFGNWHEPTAGLSFDEWLKRRPGMLRSTLKRHEARLRRSASAAFILVRDRHGLEAALADYQAVHARSWKQPEPHPGFVPAFVRAGGDAGCLRLGVLRIDGEAAAAQIWIVSQGRATIFKLAHDERFKAFSPGSLLTARMMREVLEADRVAEVDFGRGDDPYKRDWLPHRRQRWGLMAFNRATAAGNLLALRHLGAAAVKRRLRR